MTKGNWPKISIITPTLNSARTIDEYFKSIKYQKYDGEIEIIILDGGSNDKTLRVAKKNGAKIYFNKFKTAEAGKALGVKKSTGSIYAFIDSDNILSTDDWLEKLTLPFIDDSEIVISEPNRFTYRTNDHWLTRYFALIGVGDPLNLFIGNYDKFSYVTNKWTGFNLVQEKRKYYSKIKIKDKIPTIGANGALVSKKSLVNFPLGDYLFDVAVIEYLVHDKPQYIAKVDRGIIHFFSGDVWTFIRKQRRRLRDYLYYKTTDQREAPQNMGQVTFGVIKFVLACILLLPLIYQAVIGFIRKKDVVWLFHPFACYITLFSYGYETIRSIFIKEEYSREGWKQ